MSRDRSTADIAPVSGFASDCFVKTIDLKVRIKAKGMPGICRRRPRHAITVNASCFAAANPSHCRKKH
jgi:hypothetical protein